MELRGLLIAGIFEGEGPVTKKSEDGESRVEIAGFRELRVTNGRDGEERTTWRATFNATEYQSETPSKPALAVAKLTPGESVLVKVVAKTEAASKYVNLRLVDAIASSAAAGLRKVAGE